MKILVNTISTKKKAGGAFQIAYNFLLKTLHPDYSNIDWYYITSSDIDDVLGIYFKDLVNTRYFVFPTQPDFFGSYNRVKNSIMQIENNVHPDVVYSITAPSYFSFKAPEVMRFTNPWVTHPNNYSWSVLSRSAKFKTKLYCWSQRRLMRKAHFFITQTETTKQGIIRITNVPSENVKVVSNVLPEAFVSMDKSPVIDNEWINIACIGNPVPHKNFDIIPSVLKALNSLNIKNVRFHTTIPFGHPLERRIIDELNAFGMFDRIVNHGRVSQKELGKIYRSCQLCFLPTLLEVFSASTVEAMYYGLPIVATDFSFNRDVLDDSCLYYQPKNSNQAALQISQLIKNTSLQNELREKMKQRLSLYGNYDLHFKSIVDFLVKVGTLYNSGGLEPLI